MLVRQNNIFSYYPTIIMASAGKEPMATTSICLCIVLLKLNLTNLVAAVENSVKSALEIAGGNNFIVP